MNNLFFEALKGSKEFQQLNSSIEEGMNTIAVNGVAGSAISHLTYYLNHYHSKQSLIITHNELEAKKIYEDLKFFLGERAYYFPPKEIVFYDVYAHSNEVTSERLKVLNTVAEDSPCIVVATIDSIMTRLIPKELWLKKQIPLEVGNTLDLEGFIRELVYMGYERVDMVDTKGQFSIRGGIIDLFPPASDNPIRIELFDDEIDSIRKFDLETQLSVEKLNKAIVGPSREMLLNSEIISNGIENIKKELKEYKKLQKSISKIVEKIQGIISNLENHIYFDGIENFIHYFIPKTETIIEYLSKGSLIFLHEPSRLRERAQGFINEHHERFKLFFEKGELLPNQINTIVDYESILNSINLNTKILINNLPKRFEDFQPEQIIGFFIREMNSYHGKINLLIEDINNWKYRGYKIVILAGTEQKGKNLERELRNNSVECLYIQDINRKILSGQVFITKGSLNNGLIYNTFKLVIISENEIYGLVKKHKKKKKYKQGRSIRTFRDLSIGDYVVHENHGIGKYIGVEQLTVEGIKKDYLKIQYSGGDLLYVPIDQMEYVQKYIGGEDKAPKLNRLGGGEWKKTKAKAKSAIEDMARDLLKLYAIRESAKGHAFSKDSDWQSQFEDAFPYEETQDQLRCIEEIKRDMEKPMPMDRLLCGDVGYGKTEVAIRAAFKCIMDGKQVAFLVPTTILAQQHFNTLKERMSKFPVKVEMLSRFRSAAQQTKIIEKLKIGEIDIVVGTHRLLSKDVRFKDLGLLIVDEEQRFGVKHKETLKEIRKNVDVLTLTATPIPRTLHMSLVGIRDMSVIEDPPEDRYPVETYVVEYNEGIIRDAIIKELEREGQVYFVYNRVNDIDKMTTKIKKLVPEARIAYAHGQMSESKLENIMIDFLNKEFDVLICTTIIETGLDIGNVNTIIIYDADRMGLSQLYQLRGRVGRSNRIAYAFLTYRKDKILSEVAEKRLKAIKEFTELGSGFKIAMKDLEIRGAGNLLGSQQHGHMALIGYDLYCKLLEDTIRTLKGEEIQETIETSIDINIDAFISDKYIGNERHKLEIYKKIASIRELQDAYDVEEEIEDRFGTIPQPVYNLISIAYIKSLGQNLKISNITEADEGYKFEFDSNYKLNPLLISKVIEEFGNNIIFNCSNKPYFIYNVKIGNKRKELEEIKRMLEKISSFQLI